MNNKLFAKMPIPDCNYKMELILGVIYANTITQLFLSFTLINFALVNNCLPFKIHALECHLNPYYMESVRCNAYSPNQLTVFVGGTIGCLDGYMDINNK